MMEYRTISNCVIRIKLFFTRISVIWEWLCQIWIPTSSTKLAEAEQRLLSFVRFPFEQNQISIGDNLTINTIHTYNPKARQSNRKAPLVLLHGFGAGIGFWLLNIDALAEQYEHVYAIDLLGCGRSSRPHFRAKTPEEAERFFVDALERWRIEVKLDKMILLGHSLGAYIGASYTMSFPYRVPHLILASPVGVPKEPDTPLPSRRYFHSSLAWRLGRDLTIFLWKRGYTPQSGVRFMGPLGPLPVNIYVTRRFSIQPGIEDTSPATDEAGLETSAALADQIDKGKLKLPKQDLAQYLYHLCAQPGSGEFGLPCLIKSNVFAYKPLESRLGDSDISRATFIYGDNDWMDPEAGKRTVVSLNKRSNTSKQARLLVVPHAGHQLMIDNPVGFHDAVREALADHEE